jgi:hypothetical protein
MAHPTHTNPHHLGLRPNIPQAQSPVAHWHADIGDLQQPESPRTSHMKAALSLLPEPRSNDPDDSQAIRLQSMLLLQKIEMLEAEQQRIAPRVHPQLEANLFNRRQEREMIYWRNFRINQLPPEILVNIFRYVVWPTTHPSIGIKLRLWLTGVCRRWRSAAIADFTLWNAIWFTDMPPYTRSLAWFQRAGTAPLDLRLNECDPEWNNNEDQHRFTGEQMGMLLDRLFTKLTTIRTLVIVVDTWPPALVVLAKLRQMGGPGRTLNMERFELHRAGTPYVWIGPGYLPDNHRHPITLFGGASAPSLKHISLNGIHIDWQRSPIANLTTLDLRRMALEVSPKLMRFRDMLKRCPNLHKLALDGAGPRWDPQDTGGPVELPRLVILVLGDFSLQFASYVLAQISAPNVRDLTLMNMNGEDYSPLIESMTSKFVEVRLLTLYTFEVNDSPQSRQSVLKFLESLPLLSYLRIAQIQRHLIDAFLVRRDHFNPAAPRTTGYPTGRALCTKLAVLEFQKVEVETILAFGRSRRALNCPLRTIYVNYPWAVTDITEQQRVALLSICESLCLTPRGSNPPEETEIYKSVVGSSSSGSSSSVNHFSQYYY